jgi:hypothetical protein
MLDAGYLTLGRTLRIEHPISNIEHRQIIQIKALAT